MNKKFGFIIILLFVLCFIVLPENISDSTTANLKTQIDSKPVKENLNLKLQRIKKLADDLEKNGNFQSALKYYKIWTNLKDSILIETFLQQLSVKEDQHQDEIFEISKKIEQIESDKNTAVRQKNILTIILVVFLVISLGMGSFFIFNKNGFISKPVIPQDKDGTEFYATNDKKSVLESELSDIEYYAKHVQSALLTSDNIFNKIFREHLIFFKPIQQIGGDFYWVFKKDSKILVAVGDCTGHGVHGALLSILAMAYLTDIANSLSLEYSDEVLNLLKDKFLEVLQQMDDTTHSKAGIDMAICILDYEKMEAQFSGAYNLLYFISNNNLEIFRGDKLPVGFSEKEDIYFTRQNFKINEGDIIYLFTDGYCDQFGGENRKKFMTKRFSHLLLNIYQFPMDKQKEWLDKTLVDWKKDNDQVDDITVIGLKI